MTGHSPWDELAVGQALGALEPEDEQTFVSHVRGCSECAQTVADIEAVSGELAYAVPSEEPPRALLESIMREVTATARVATPLGSAMPDVSRLRGPRRRSAAAPAARTAVRWDAPWMARAAVLILVLALTSWNYQLRLDNKVKQTSLANAAAAGRLMADPATGTTKLTGKGAEKASVLVNGSEAYLVVDDFKRNDAEDSIYVLWAQDKGSDAMRGVGLFKVVHDGATYIPVRNLANGAGIVAFAVSREAGSVIPTVPSTPLTSGATPAAA